MATGEGYRGYARLINLPFLSDQQLEQIKNRAQLSGIDLDVCPTCFSEEDHLGRRNYGTYRYKGTFFNCICDEQIQLYKHYLLASIPTQYQRLSLEDWQGDDAPIEVVRNYLDHWMSFKSHGMGLEFYSRNLASGKTYLACEIGKALIKRHEKVIFVPFNQMITAFRYNEQELIDKLYNTTVLILDEIIAPPHDNLASIFAERFEDIIRNRTNYNGVCICTTNLTPSELHHHYPRTYSLLEAKQIRVEMPNGEDARMGFIAKRNLEMAINSELPPLC